MKTQTHVYGEVCVNCMIVPWAMTPDLLILIPQYLRLAPPSFSHFPVFIYMDDWMLRQPWIYPMNQTRGCDYKPNQPNITGIF